MNRPTLWYNSNNPCCVCVWVTVAIYPGPALTNDWQVTWISCAVPWCRRGHAGDVPYGAGKQCPMSPTAAACSPFFSLSTSKFSPAWRHRSVTSTRAWTASFGTFRSHLNWQDSAPPVARTQTDDVAVDSCDANVLAASPNQVIDHSSLLRSVTIRVGEYTRAQRAFGGPTMHSAPSKRVQAVVRNFDDSYKGPT